MIGHLFLKKAPLYMWCAVSIRDTIRKIDIKNSAH